MPPVSVSRDRAVLALLAGAAYVVLLAMDLWDDDFVPSSELLADAFQHALLVGCAVASTLLVGRVRAQEEAHRLLSADVAVIREEGQRWREEAGAHLDELGAAIQRQFEAWRLTAAEQDVALLLLKGFSHKEIARLRKATESTVRQQAASLYDKARLSGRAALSAFFLEDLLLPGALTASRDASRGLDTVREAS